VAAVPSATFAATSLAAFAAIALAAFCFALSWMLL